MDIASVQDALQKRPFEPFVIRLADGRSIQVPRPDAIAVTSRRIVVPDEDDSWQFIEPMLIVSVEPLRSS